jgi:mono/diheme cytochrome c family protein
MKKAMTMMAISMITAGAAWGQMDFNAVQRGKEVFETMGCIVCHSSVKDDPSAKTGPNLHGLFLTEPREREVMVPATGEKKKVKADQAYFNDSIRKSWDLLAISEKGDTKGTAYGAIMPMFAPEVISDEDLESIWHYVRTMAEGHAAGPAEVMLKKKDAPAAASACSMQVQQGHTADATHACMRPAAGVKGAYVSVPVVGGSWLSREELLDLRCKVKGEKVL